VSQQVAAERIGKARTRMVQLEDGRGTLTPEELTSLLDFYEVSADERRTVLELGALARTRQKKRAHTDLLPGSFQRQANTLDSTEPKVLRFVVSEVALRAAVGSPEVMCEQRRHILNLLEGKRNLTVRVLRDDAYGNPARAGGFMIFRFGGRGAPVGFAPVVYGPSTYFDNESDTAAMLRAFERLQELALGPEESARLIRQIDEES
jgi:uncharacterized protein DUF5753/helix-turn-helix protein